MGPRYNKPLFFREDDNLQTQYGPLDQKDSMNLFLYFIDSITWPENLRFYLSSDPVYNAGALDVLATCEYPFTNVENRLKVIFSFLNPILVAHTSFVFTIFFVPSSFFPFFFFP